MSELQKAIEAKLLKEILEESDTSKRFQLINAYREFACASQVAQAIK